MRKNSLRRVRRLNFVRPPLRLRILALLGRILNRWTARWNLRRPVSAAGMIFRLTADGINGSGFSSLRLAVCFWPQPGSLRQRIISPFCPALR